MACPVVYERQVLRLGPVDQSVGWQPWWRGKGGRGRAARGLASRSRLSQITSCHLGSAGLAPTLSGENTRVNILSFEAPQKIFPGPSSRPAQSRRPHLSLSLSRLLLPRRGESRDVEPAFQKSTLMMLISRGGPGLLRVTRDLAEPFAMPAIARSPRGTFDPMIYGSKGLKRLTVRCSPLLRFFFNHPFPPRFLFARIN